MPLLDAGDRHLIELIQIAEQLLCVTPLHPHLHTDLKELSVRGTTIFEFIGMKLHTVLLELFKDSLYALLRGGGEGEINRGHTAMGHQ